MASASVARWENVSSYEETEASQVMNLLTRDQRADTQSAGTKYSLSQYQTTVSTEHRIANSSQSQTIFKRNYFLVYIISGG